MAHAAAHTNTTVPFFAGIGRAFAAVGTWLVRIGEAHPRNKALKQLSEISDAELAERGLTRQDIIRHVMRDSYHI